MRGDLSRGRFQMAASTQTRKERRGTALGVRRRAASGKEGGAPPGTSPASSVWFFSPPSQVTAHVPRTGPPAVWLSVAGGGWRRRAMTGRGARSRGPRWRPPRRVMRPGTRQSPELTGIGCGRHPGGRDKRCGGEGQDRSLAVATLALTCPPPTHGRKHPRRSGGRWRVPAETCPMGSGDWLETQSRGSLGTGVFGPNRRAESQRVEDSRDSGEGQVTAGVGSAKKTKLLGRRLDK